MTEVNFPFKMLFIFRYLKKNLNEKIIILLKLLNMNFLDIFKKAINNVIEESIDYSKFRVYEIYNGKSGGAYRASRYLAEAISSKNKIPIYSSMLNEGIQFEPSEHNKGGIIVFSTDVNSEKQSENRFINFLKQKMKTIFNRLNATKKIDKIAAKNELVGWTIGYYLNGRYTSPKNGKQYGENSLSLEIIGVDFEKLYTIAMEICDSFSQESVLLKDFSSGRVLFVDKT